MTLNKIGDKKFIVNLFADFLLKKIPSEESTVLQISDCENFYVVKGKTSSTEILNLEKLVEEFTDENSNHLNNFKITHTIDLIEYNSKFENKSSFEFIYYDTENCSYSVSDYRNHEFGDNLITSLIINSDFPHGYSLNQGRLLYYYGKHIVYNIPSSYPFKSLSLTLPVLKNENLFNVFNNDNNSWDESLRSAILDVFDFNYSELEQEIKKVDWSIELTNPLQDYDFLKKKVKDFIII